MDSPLSIRAQYYKQDLVVQTIERGYPGKEGFNWLSVNRTFAAHGTKLQ